MSFLYFLSSVVRFISLKFQQQTKEFLIFWKNLNLLREGVFFTLFNWIMHNSCKTNIDIEEASKFSLSHFKLHAALKLCIDLFFAEWCWTLFSSSNSIINRSRNYFTRLKMRLRKETFTDQIHRDAYLTLQENSWN